MAVNALGQTLQLLLNQAAPGDLSLGAKPGDLLQARIVDIFPDNKAIISLKGQNLVAQLPEPQAGQVFSKGVLLDLTVLQSSSQQARPAQAQAAPVSGQPQSAATAQPSAPALTLKLIGISTQQPTNFNPGISPESTAAPLPQPTLEALLTSAKLPVNSQNLQAAQTLNRYGLPLDSQSLHSVIQTAGILIQAESPVPSAPADAAELPEGIRQPLQEARTLLNLVSAEPARSSERPLIQSIQRQIDAMLTPAAQFQPTSAGTADADGLPEAAPRFQSSAEIAPALEKALNQISDARPQALPSFNSLLSDIKASLPALQPAPAAAPEALDAAPVQSQAAVEAAPEIPEQLFKSARREVAAALSRDLQLKQASQPVAQDSLMQSLQALKSEARMETLSASVLLQVPDDLPEAPQPSQARQAVQAAISEIEGEFLARPLPKPVATVTAFAAELEIRELPAPKIALSSLPPEQVLEAVAFLKARQIPVTRATVELLASQLSQGSDLGTDLNAVLAQAAELPDGFTEMHPALKREIAVVREFVQTHALKPEARDLSGQISRFVAASGTDLEQNLLSLATPEGPKARPDAPRPADTLKANLLKLRDEVQQASRQTIAAASPEISEKLETFARKIDSAIDALSVMQLSSRPTPAFDVSTVQLPVMFGGQIQSGQLSVYWKKGQEKVLNAKDPVNVVFLLNTRGLGEVKVQLQVWKEECRCKVTVSDEEARKMIEDGADGLKQSFADNTAFKLSSLDISGAMEPVRKALDFVSELADRRAGQLNISA